MIKVIKSIDKMILICHEILSKLPAHFPFIESSENYIKNTKDIIMIVKEDVDGKPLGFLTFAPKNKTIVEIHVIGVDPKFQRQGIGSSLINKAKHLAAANNFIFLIVKVVNYKLFNIARNFYEKNGFINIDLTPKTNQDNNLRSTMVMVLSKKKFKFEDGNFDKIC